MAAISVSLVALPLALGIALASGVPPISGIISAIIGGIVITFFRGSHLAINGPAAGLIAVILSAISLLNDGSGQTLNYLFAAIVVSGLIQALLGLFQLGKFANIFPSSVIHGVLAAIGVIIIAKQIHVCIGTNSNSTNTVMILYDVIKEIKNINPVITLISIIGLLILIFHSKISYNFFRFLPSPIWVLAFSVPFVYLFDFFTPHEYTFINSEYYLGPELLIELPDKIIKSLVFPDFSKIFEANFWIAVISITTISSVQTLAMAKAVDKLDPYSRKTNLNKDLFGVGLGTIISGFIGGLPIITVIIRSTVNIHNNAKTKWSNLYHGVLLILFVFLLNPIIQKIPLAALAIILVYTGYKLSSPKLFKLVYKQGVEQFILFFATLSITLFTDLLYGILGGTLIAIILHLLLSNCTLLEFFNSTFYSKTNLYIKKDGSYELNIKGISNFLNIIALDKYLDQIPNNANVKINFKNTRLVGLTILERIYAFKDQQEKGIGQIKIIGLDKHVSSSDHKLALKILKQKQIKLSKRQTAINSISKEFNWLFKRVNPNGIKYLKTFYFFKRRIILEKLNSISSPIDNTNIRLEITDILFDDGAMLSSEEYKTTIAIINLPFQIPKFTIERKGITDKFLNLTRAKDIDYLLYKQLPNQFLVKVENKDQMDSFLTKPLKTLIQNNSNYHLESNGESILLFNNSLTIAQISNIVMILDYCNTLKAILSEKNPDLLI